MSHQADAIVLSCIDYRFRTAFQQFFAEELKIQNVDHMAQGGGVKMILEDGPIRDWTFLNFDIAFVKHNVNHVILINHQDCGAYGSSNAFPNLVEEIQFQENQLRQAAQVINAKYTGKTIQAYLALLNTSGEVTFKTII